MDTTNIYQSPLVTRGSSPEMAKIWSDEYKFRLWRKLWVELADAQMKLGLPIKPWQVSGLRDALGEPINYELAKQYEHELHHDVMAHIKTFSDHVPEAGGIIHLGATSQYVVDNADSIRIKESMAIIIKSLRDLIIKFGEFADTFKDVPTLGLTHFQPAQPTTVGRRAALWGYDLYLILEQLQYKYDNLKALGVKGATGTQASFLDLFDGDHEKVELLDKMVCDAIGFDRYLLTGQVYSRTDDAILISLLAATAASCQKTATDIRLLAGKGEVNEGFGKKQVGSSAMPYKRNPLYCERVCGLAKFTISMASAAMNVASEQWLERSLDDSSARRLVLPEAFLSLNNILNTMSSIISNLVVNTDIVASNLNAKFPLLIMEKILMLGVKHGANRQRLHEKLRNVSLQTSGHNMELYLQELAKIPELGSIDLLAMANMDLTGRAAGQVEEFRKLIQGLGDK